MLRGQLCLYVQATDCHGWSAAGGVGLVEAPAGTFQDERILSFLGRHGKGSDVSILPGQYLPDKVEYHGEEIGSYVRYAIWPRPVPGSGIIGGGLIFRRTRLPSPHGCETMLVSTCLYAPTGILENQKRYSISGSVSEDGAVSQLVIHDPVHNAYLAENGIGMDSLLKKPAWGWGDKPIALQSTLRLDTIDESMEIRRLIDVEGRTDTEKARLDQLRGSHGWGVVNIGRDDRMFDEFRRRSCTAPPFDDWSRPVTEAQYVAREQHAEQIIREMTQEGWHPHA